MPKPIEVYENLVAKFGLNVVIAVVIGLLLAIFVHPVAGIVAGGGFYLFRTGKLETVIAWVKDKFITKP